MKTFLTTMTFIACCWISVFATETKAIVINADNAEYDGKNITLRGSVVVDHPIGILSANDVLMKPKAGIDGELISVELNDCVALRFTEGGHLSCSNAFLDIVNNLGTCRGDTQREHVVYTENVAGRKGEKIPVVMKCKTLSLTFEPEDKNSKGSVKDKIRNITANDDVTISYNHDFIASGNNAIYSRIKNPSADTLPAEFPGKIVLTNGEAGGSCLVTNKCGDLVYANTIEIDTSERQLVLDAPKGSIHRDSSIENSEDVLYIRSDVASWKENEGVIILKGRVEVNDPVMGFLRSDDEIRLFSSDVQCKKWGRAESIGESALIYKTPGNPSLKTLKCFDLCVLDNEKMEARLTSPKDENEKISPEKQVFYSDEKGEIFADRVLIKYKNDGKETKPYHIILTGHVKILNKVPDMAHTENPARQYILADNVEFFPETQQMVLSSTKGRRVLLYDEENDIQMSAQGIKIARDNVTKRDAIEGCGDVRFHLVQNEIEKIRQQFSLEKITSKLIKKHSEE